MGVALSSDWSTADKSRVLIGSPSWMVGGGGRSGQGGGVAVGGG